MPTQTSGVHAAATATLPVEFDYEAWSGDPLLFALRTGTNRAAGAYNPAERGAIRFSSRWGPARTERRDCTLRAAGPSLRAFGPPIRPNSDPIRGRHPR